MINGVGNFFKPQNTADKSKNETELSVFYINDTHGDVNRATKVKTAKEGQDIVAIKTAIEELTSEMSKIGEAMNKASGENTENKTEESKPEDNIKDAEVKEEDQNKENNN